MGFFAGIIGGLFMYGAGYYLMGNVITGTSVAEVVLQNIVPLALAVPVLIAAVRFGG